MLRLHLFYVVVAAFAGLAVTPAAAVEIAGVPRIIDGDTVEIGTTRIRLSGADAPEIEQTCLDEAGQSWKCGERSKEELDRWTANRTWVCQAGARNRYGQRLATCIVEGRDVARAMISTGWALSYARFNRAYVADEAAARTARAGLWSGSFVNPWDWRSRNRMARLRGRSASGDAMATLMARPGQAVPPSACRIKANTARNGSCTYFAPGTRRYRFVNMKIGGGKRWFCSESEAQAAGCKAAQ